MTTGSLTGVAKCEESQEVVSFKMTLAECEEIIFSLFKMTLAECEEILFSLFKATLAECEEIIFDYLKRISPSVKKFFFVI